MSAASKVLIAVLTVLAAGATLAMCGRVSERGRFALSYSTYGAGPTGARALYELTRASGFEASRWNEDVADLPSPATLVALGGCDHLQARTLSRPEREALVRWVEAGGTWIVAGATELLEVDGFGVRLEPQDELACLDDDGLLAMIVRADRRARDRRRASEDEPDAPTEGEIREGEPDDGGTRDGETLDDEGAPASDAANDDPIAALARSLTGREQPERTWVGGVGPLTGLTALGLRHPGSIRVEDDVPHEVLAEADGRAAMVVVPRGRGRVVVLASASLLQNRDLVTAEGAPLFVRLLQRYAQGPVLFDEYHLGAGEARSTMRYLFQRGAGPLALQLLVVLAIALGRAGHRFGAPRRDPEPEVVTTASFVAAIGGLFAKVRDPSGSLAILVRRACMRIAEHHHLEAHEPTALEQALRERHRLRAADAVHRIGALATQTPSSLTQATSELDALTQTAVSDGA